MARNKRVKRRERKLREERRKKYYDELIQNSMAESKKVIWEHSPINKIASKIFVVGIYYFLFMLIGSGIVVLFGNGFRNICKSPSSDPIEIVDTSKYNNYHLDEILDYDIYVKPDKSDGSLYITYDISWLVLDSDKEKLTWVKIGIPNKYTEDIKALSNNISKIGYLDDSGDYVRIDFRNSYKEGQAVDFSFSIHAHRLYKEDGSNRLYSFTPGWFHDIDIDNIEVIWDISEIEGDIIPQCPYGKLMTTENSISFYGSLNAGRKFETIIKMPDSAFDNDDLYEKEISEDLSGYMFWFVHAFGFLAFCFGCPLIAYLVFYAKAIIWSVDSYQKGKTYLCQDESSIAGYMRRFRKEHEIEYEEIKREAHKFYEDIKGSGSGHGRSYGGGGCACACACACAGGGRAGCSTKDFYGTILNTEQIHKVYKSTKQK